MAPMNNLRVPRHPATRRRRPWLWGPVSAGVVAATLVGAPVAQATYPGSPGVLVFGAFSDGQSDLYSAAADGTGLAQLTATPGSVDICPAVSADGRRIASCRNAGARPPTRPVGRG